MSSSWPLADASLPALPVPLESGTEFSVGSVGIGDPMVGGASVPGLVVRKEGVATCWDSILWIALMSGSPEYKMVRSVRKYTAFSNAVLITPSKALTVGVS